MKIRLGLTVPLLLAAAPAVIAQAPRDATIVDPAHHQVLFENQHVRVFRAMASSGARSPMHTHPSFVFVSLATGRARLTTPDGGTGNLDLQPEQVLWLENPEHSWEMVAGQLHVVAVEVKAAARGTPPPAMTLPGTDAVAVDPVMHQVVLDNPYVRVLEGLAGEGVRSPVHTHSSGFALISLARARLRLSASDGSSSIVDFHPGQVIWLDATTHSWEVVSGQLRVIAVEVKSAR